MRRHVKREAIEMTAGVERSRFDQGKQFDEPETRAVVVDARLYESARLIADLRSERVEDVVARALRTYAQGRKRPRD